VNDAVNIDDYRPHVSVYPDDGSAHVIPVEYFERVFKGMYRLSEMVKGEGVIQKIFQEWIDEQPIVSEDTREGLSREVIGKIAKGEMKLSDLGENESKAYFVVREWLDNL
jgi:hypothetical protein